MPAKLQQSLHISLPSRTKHTHACIHAHNQILTFPCAVCLRNLSRSVKNLRTCLRDAQIARPLCKLLEDPQAGTDILAAAAVCNIVLEFSPMRTDVLACGGLPVLVRLLDSKLHVLRVNALWALKNLCYLADKKIKDVS